jgi:hypothetical protein
MNNWGASVSIMLSFVLVTGCSWTGKTEKSVPPVSVEAASVIPSAPASQPPASKSTPDVTLTPPSISGNGESPDDASPPPKGTDPYGKSEGMRAPSPDQVEEPVTPPAAKESVVNNAAGNGESKAESLKKEYRDQLLQLKDVYLGKLQGVYQEAMSTKKSGKSNNEVYKAFSHQAMALQEESQADVNQLLAQMKNKLAVQQLPSDSVNELRAAYYAEINKAEADITGKAKSDLAK